MKTTNENITQLKNKINTLKTEQQKASETKESVKNNAKSKYQGAKNKASETKESVKSMYDLFMSPTVKSVVRDAKSNVKTTAKFLQQDLKTASQNLRDKVKSLKMEDPLNKAIKNKHALKSKKTKGRKL